MPQQTVEVTTYAQLRELHGEPLARVRDKARTTLNDIHRAWIAQSPFCVIATAASDGTCDASPKGDPPGFARVVDDTTVAVPDRPGNKRIDGFRNVLANPHVGLLFVVPGRGDTLRVNGRARLLSDAPYFDDMVVRGHRPRLAVEVSVEEVYFHCAKAFMRSRLWEPESWTPESVPSRPQIAKRLERPDDPIEELERYYGDQYARRLY